MVQVIVLMWPAFFSFRDKTQTTGNDRPRHVAQILKLLTASCSSWKVGIRVLSPVISSSFLISGAGFSILRAPRFLTRCE